MRAADYVVVGSGSAGSVIARRLADSGASVILIEAGRRDNTQLVRKPVADEFDVIDAAMTEDLQEQRTALQPDPRWPFPGDVSPGSPAAEYNASLDVVDDLV